MTGPGSMKRNTRLRTRGNRRANRLSTVIGMLLLWGASLSDAHAAVAKCTNSSSGELARVPDQLKISADVPINTVIWSQKGIQISAICSKTLPLPGTGGVEATLYRWSDDPKLLANGLALYVTYNGNRGHGLASFPTGTTIKAFGETTVKATVDVELVKVGPTPAVPTAFPVVSILTVLIGGPDNAYSDSARYLTYGFNSMSFQPTTCATTTPSVAVDLGTEMLSKSSGLGSGVGSTSAEKGFSIGLRCDAGVAGAFAVNLMLDGNAVDESNGVLALSSSSGAEGVGIQLLKGDGQPVPLGRPWKVADSLSSSMLVPLSARYYQTRSLTKTGTANGAATFTIIYQ